jgi:fatty aldehyde-generating acyl-ACP reductase
LPPFAFIVHPLSIEDLFRKRKYRFARYLPASWVESALRFIHPQVVSEITGVRSATGAETTGWFIGCPYTAKQLISGDAERNTEMVIACAHLAAKQGAQIVGLGAFTSIVGDAGISIAAATDIGVTTGNSYTVATAIEGTLLAAQQVGLDPATARAAILGATGSIGKVCARLLAPQVGSLTLAARRKADLNGLAAELSGPGAVVDMTTDLNSALRDADLVIAVTSAVDALIQPEMLKPGAVVCDVARPRDVSKKVADMRDDVLVIEGGAVAVPGEVDFHFDFGFPPRTAYACMAETMILALEGRTGDYSLGRDIQVEQVDEIAALARKHGFALAGFRSFERAVTEEQIAKVREAAKRG